MAAAAIVGTAKGSSRASGLLQHKVIEEATRKAALRAVDKAKWLQVSRLFERLDADGDGLLNLEEVGKLLAALNGGTEPSDDEMTFMSRMAGWQPPFRYFELAELRDAIRYWQGYVEDFKAPQAWGSEVFEKFDRDGSGRLDRKELRTFLTELNRGVEASDEDVDWVLRKSDVTGDGSIQKIELLQAVSVWFQRIATLRHRSTLYSCEEPKSSRLCVLQ